MTNQKQFDVIIVKFALASVSLGLLQIYLGECEYEIILCGKRVHKNAMLCERITEMQIPESAKGNFSLVHVCVYRKVCKKSGYGTPRKISHLVSNDRVK